MEDLINSWSRRLNQLGYRLDLAIKDRKASRTEMNNMAAELEAIAGEMRIHGANPKPREAVPPPATAPEF